MVKLPTLPAADAHDPTEVATSLADATKLWDAKQYAEALPLLLNAALLASARLPVDSPRVKELARAATEISQYLSAPGSIAISIQMSDPIPERLTPAAVVDAVSPPVKRVRKGTLPEESRPPPDTVRVDVDVPPPPTIDLSGTVPQGYPPAPTTRRVDPKQKP